MKNSKFIVQKFGGTSVGGGQRMVNVSEIIKGQSQPVIAVVSATSATLKTKGTTSMLLDVAKHASAGEPYWPILREISKKHTEIVAEAISSLQIRDELQTLIGNELKRLGRFLDALKIIRELTSNSNDEIISVGERLSAQILCHTLRDRGVAARCVDFSHIIEHGVSELSPSFFRELGQKLATEILKHDETLVVPGYMGHFPNGIMRDVGRGYTDFTAALISAGLGKHCAEFQVWKEVDGVFTADPRKIPQARVLKWITAREASELTYFGSEVLHPFTMATVIDADIAIRIKNTFHPELEGTTIVKELPADYASGSVRAVTAKSDITLINIESNRMYNAHGFMFRIFKILDNYQTTVDLISTSEVTVSFTTEKSLSKECLEELEELGGVSISARKAILAIVGTGMKSSVGTAARMFQSLSDKGINIEVITQGASEINISCVIATKDVSGGLEAIHQEFIGGS